MGDSNLRQTMDKGASAPVEILYVEDELDLLFLVSKRLEWEGFHVETATTVEEARAALERHTPDILLLDLMLPDGSGLNVLSEVREKGRQRNLPVIVLTGVGHNEAIEEGFSKGANAYLTKPVSTEKLMQAIQVILEEKSTQKPS